MAALSVSLVALLIAMPPAAALAESSAAPSTTTVSAPPILELTTAQLGPVLSNIPIKDLGMTEAELGVDISGLNPGLGSDISQLTGVVSTLLSKNPTANLGELVSSLSNQTGLLGTLLKTLLPSLTPTQLVEGLNPAHLEELLANLSGGNPAEALSTEGLSKLLSGLSWQLTRTACRAHGNPRWAHCDPVRQRLEQIPRISAEAPKWFEQRRIEYRPERPQACFERYRSDPVGIVAEQTRHTHAD